MTKPQTASEPSMEDILASIRKMISEDRLEARPIPDQIARTSIGERAPPRPVPKPVNQDRVEKAQSAEAKPVSAAPTAAGGEPAAPERPVPSFSSLSDALKSAAPGAVRPSLDDKLADMLDAEEKPASNGRDSIPPAAPLAVFAGSRAQPASPGKPQLQNGSGAAKQDRAEPRAAAFPDQAPPSSVQAEPRTHQPNGARVQSTLKPVPEKLPPVESPSGPSATNGAALNGSFAHKHVAAPSIAPAAPAVANIKERPREAAKQNSSGTETAAADHDNSLRTTRLSTPQPNREVEPSIGEPKAETQRIITMPARAAVSSSQISSPHGGSLGLIKGSETKGAQSNGALPNVDPTGSRASVFGLRPTGVQPAAGRALASQDVEARAERPVKAEHVKPEVSSNKAAALIGETPQVLKVHDAAPKLEAKEPSEALEAFKKAVAEHHNEASAPPAAGVAAASGPSEKLVDAVMELVHAEPHTLSVFTSGASFIHGVGSSHHTETPAELPELVLPEGQASHAVTPKLDRSAAELLRPMLRQWLADNMPRIVEEALRSELMSSQGDEIPEKG